MTPDPTETALRLQNARRWAEAAAAWEAALMRRPDHADGWYNLGFVRRQAGDPHGALAAYDRALALGAEGPEEIRVNRAVIYADLLNRPEEAEAELRAALALNPAYRPARINLGNLYEDLGDRERSRAHYEAMLADDPGDRHALARLAAVVPAEEETERGLCEALRRALGAVGSDFEDRAALGFALARRLDALERYDEAFDAALDANAAARAAAPPALRRYDPEAYRRALDASRALPPVDEAGRDGRELVFVCGMFRSGSTLLEQILGAHPAIQSLGELPHLPRFAASIPNYPAGLATLPAERLEAMRRAYLAALPRDTGAVLFTDKRPDNVWHAPLIRRLFPAAKIVVTERERLDNCVSVFFMHAAPQVTYAYDPAECSTHWRLTAEAAALWKATWPAAVRGVGYEALIADPQGTATDFLAWLGLPFDPACLEFHRTKGLVRTESVWQVRRPIYRSSAGRSRNYARRLEGL